MSKMKFEESLSKLEEIIERLENEQITLDESLLVFEEGIKLYRLCNQELNETEKKIYQIIEEDGELNKIPFESPEE